MIIQETVVKEEDIIEEDPLSDTTNPMVRTNGNFDMLFFLYYLFFVNKFSNNHAKKFGLTLFRYIFCFLTEY